MSEIVQAQEALAFAIEKNGEIAELIGAAVSFLDTAATTVSGQLGTESSVLAAIVAASGRAAEVTKAAANLGTEIEALQEHLQAVQNA